MRLETKQRIGASVQDFRLPRYVEIPNVGLYLEQAAKYISEYLSPLGDYALTPSMISNYVKKSLISSPIKKQYSRDQLVYLIFIAVGKNLLSLDALGNFLEIQKHSYPLQKAYDYFCNEFENLLRFTFELQDTIDVVGEDSTDEKRILYTCIAAVTQKVYLEKCLAAIAEENAGDGFLGNSD